MNPDRIVKECKVDENDPIDSRILYELAGIKLKNEQFDDDSSFEDAGQILDNFVHYARQQTNVEPENTREPPLLSQSTGTMRVLDDDELSESIFSDDDDEDRGSGDLQDAVGDGYQEPLNIN